ncbi:sensor histidine kinase [Streptomyces sp. NPDC096310]|uniref:sensor histidine kinase n=1 Tax=Streptomyces sp. NPDC096310 TaxID=3366082 RepID=UPI003824C8FB
MDADTTAKGPVTDANAAAGDDPHGQDWSAGAQPLTGRLNRLAGRIRRFDRRHPLIWDIHLTAFFVLAALIDASGGWRTTALDPHTATWLVTVVSLGLSVPLLWRRSRPVTVVLVTLPFALVNAWSGAHLQAGFLGGVLLCNIALRLPLRTLAGSATVSLAPFALAITRYTDDSWNHYIVPGSNVVLMGALLGLAVRSRQEYTASLVERARRLEIERDQQARLAAAAERARIAREMHDIIGHNLSVITGLADGGSYAAEKNPRRAVEALEAIGTTSRQALTELRRLLDVLRENSDGETVEAAELAPQPALADLHHLVDGVRAAGLPVRMTVRGHADPLPAGQQLTVYRVVQEALTNTLKHADPTDRAGEPTRADVDVSYARDGVTATVTDSGAPGPAHRGEPATVTGRGLTGMRERAALYDGTLEAGPLPHPADGWRVRLHLPGPRKDTADQ